MLLSTPMRDEPMTREELNEKIRVEQTRSRAAIEKADAFLRWFDREAPIQEAKTRQAFRELRESVRRR